MNKIEEELTYKQHIEKKRLEKFWKKYPPEIKDELKSRFAEKTLKNIHEMSGLLSSNKRLLILFFLEKRPLFYTEMVGYFKYLKVKIGASESYKHFKVLKSFGLIERSLTRDVALQTSSYKLTEKGKKFVDDLNRLLENY